SIPMKKVVFFDLWWTIVHYKRGSLVIKKIINYVSSRDKKLGKALEEHTMTRDDIRLEDRFSDFASEYGVKHKAANKILVKLWNRMQKKAVPYKDTVLTLQALKEDGLKIALITNSIEVRDMLKRMKLIKYFDEILISSEVGLIKPDPKIYELAMKRLNVKPSECIMIGDDINRDIVPSRKLGLTSILIHRSPRKKRFEEPHYVIKRLSDLPHLIDEINEVM
ncbi:MAG: HAD family hydrolase, partial [Candidatus Diapherotrites archaeon]|nr:HAD family hydrolase [Candidatus Diapherotrites archaeon]